MSRYAINESTLKDIADAIRGKAELETPLKPSDMADIITNLPQVEILDAELNTYEEEVTEQTTKIEDIVETLKDKGIIGAKELNVTPSKDNQVIEGIYNKVNVAGDEDLLPENIKSGVNIFGVDGSAEVAGFEINDCRYLFYQGARLNYANEILAICKNVTSMSNMFYQAKNISDYVDKLDFSNFDSSNVKDMTSMFYSSSGLDVLDLSNLNTSNVENMYGTFNAILVNNLNLSGWDMGKVINVNGFFGYAGIRNLNFGTNLGKGYTQKSNNYGNYKLDVQNVTALTHDSLMSIINGLYDLNLTYNVAGGGTLYTQQLVIGANNLSKLTTDELNIAVNKGWSVS